MTQFFESLITFYQNIATTLMQYSFDVFGINVSIFHLLIGFILVSIVITVFWRGARG